MLFTSLLLLTSGLASAGGIERRAVISSPSAINKQATPLGPSSNTLTLTRQKSAKGYNARSAAYLLHHNPSIPKSNHNTGLLSLEIGEEFATNITFGHQTFVSIVDTGSSDTWVVQNGFQCVNVTTEAPLPEAECAFGPTLASDAGFSQIPNQNFNITYGDGEFLTGIVGFEDVTLAGIKVRQEVALVDYAAWFGDSTTSGLTGFAYPALTSAYQGNTPSNDTVQVPYSPLFKTMYTQGLTAPLFSLAILRDISGPSGYLSLGGTPPVDFVNDFTSTPILVTTITGYPKGYDFYTIEVESVQVGRKSSPGGKYIVDSGTTLNYMPTPIATAVNNAFSPPAVYSDDVGAYLVDCKAKAPSLGITISGTVFYTNPLDMILLAGTDENGNDVCITGVVDGGDDPSEDVYILGDVFQKNVVSVFDIGAVEMRFAPREFYPSNDPY